MNEIITLSHGSGGRTSQELINGLLKRHFQLPDKLTDAAHFPAPPPEHSLAFSTDSFVVTPLFFPGGDIGKLAVCGTVNDLAAAGSQPQFLSCSLIIEEGLALTSLEKAVQSLGQWARQAGVKIITGDTKVVARGQADGLFINTAGIGFVSNDLTPISSAKELKSGDVLLLNGTIGDHATTLLAERNNLQLSQPLESDCAPLNGLVQLLLDNGIRPKFMRDATRGGLATVLCELADLSGFGLTLTQSALPIRTVVKNICELYGFDSLYLANEGKMLMAVALEQADQALSLIRSHELGHQAAIIGQVTTDHPGLVTMQTTVGGQRIIDMLAGDQLPRIC
jgi:hydrogenase expression/formation protein HypE